MSKRKSPSLGNGIRVQVTFQELMAKYSEEKGTVLKAQLFKNIAEHFPEEISKWQREGLSKLNARRWQEFFAPTKRAEWKPYPVSPELLVRRAQSQSVRVNRSAGAHRVTDFSNWVFRHYHGGSSTALQGGKLGERTVRSLALLNIDDNPVAGDWKLVAFDALNGRPEAHRISMLTVNGEPIYGAPDYVFRNERTSTTLIVEVKTFSGAFHHLPSDGWPDLRAQLWAYGHIDEFFEDSKQIILVGEVWQPTTVKSLRLVQTLRWDLADNGFYSANEALFNIYRERASLVSGHPGEQTERDVD